MAVRAGAGALVDPSQWPLVGRDDELALGCAAVAAHGGVVLTGAAGVGKTRLAHEVLTQEAAAGDRMEWIAATRSAASIPLGAAAHLVPQGSMRESRDAMLRTIVGALEHQRGAGRLLLGVDDAHLLDDASAALVHILATTGTASVVVTVRGGELMPDPIVALWKDRPVPLVSLQALSRDEVEELVSSVLEGPIEGALLHLLWESSAGNALFLGELVRHGIQSGALRRERGLWSWPGRFEPGERLQDLVALRMGSLDEDQRVALELVAVGEPLARACARALGIAAVLARLEERGLVVSRRPTATEIGLSHPLFGEVARARMRATRADEVRLRLAEALEATSGVSRPTSSGSYCGAPTRASSAGPTSSGPRRVGPGRCGRRRSRTASPAPPWSSAGTSRPGTCSARRSATRVRSTRRSPRGRRSRSSPGRIGSGPRSPSPTPPRSTIA